MNAKAITGKKFWALTGPALVASVAYLDPGNVATNLTAGTQYGYSLLWVLITANVLAWFVQYLAAKLGLATNQSLSKLMGSRIKTRFGRTLYWLQAQAVAIATDMAEIIGGAIALLLLFHIPLFIGALVTAALSTALLYYQTAGHAKTFEVVIIGLIGLTTIGFFISMFYGQGINYVVDYTATNDSPSAVRTVSMAVLSLGILGATIMPHAVYVHSALSSDRLGVFGKKSLLKVIRIDVTIAMLIAGAVNVSLLVIGAKLGPISPSNDLITGVFRVLSENQNWVAGAFALALFASSLASTSVGTYTGDVILDGLQLRKPLPLYIRQLITLVPALFVLGISQSPTIVLVVSQVFISFGIPFALFPLVKLTSEKKLMKEHVNSSFTKVFAYTVVIALTLLNVWVIVSVLQS